MVRFLINKIRTAMDLSNVNKDGTYAAHVIRLVMQRYNIRPNLTINEIAKPVCAIVVRSQWCAECECGGAIVIEPGEPYFCPDCCNAEFDGLARKIIWPDDKEKIEKMLIKRPFPYNRNWIVGETLADLEMENVEHGVN